MMILNRLPDALTFKSDKKYKVIYKMEANDRKTNSKEIGSCSVCSSAVCTTLHAYVCDLSLENHSE